MNPTMHISVTCPRCESKFQLAADLRGKRVRCPNPTCRRVFEVCDDKDPQATGVATPPDAVPVPAQTFPDHPLSDDDEAEAPVDHPATAPPTPEKGRTSQRGLPVNPAYKLYFVVFCCLALVLLLGAIGAVLLLFSRFAPTPIPHAKPADQFNRSRFNQELIEKYNLKEQDFALLQFYLADDLILKREVSKEDLKRGTKKGKLVQSKGSMFEEIAIYRDTPGVCVRVEKDESGAKRLSLCFEAGTDLKFGRQQDEASYVAISTDAEEAALVVFAGNTYRTTKFMVRAAYVVVGEESLNNLQVKRKELKGVKLPE